MLSLSDEGGFYIRSWQVSYIQKPDKCALMDSMVMPGLDFADLKGTPWPYPEILWNAICLTECNRRKLFF